MEEASFSFDSPSEYIHPAESATTIASDLAVGAVVIDYLRFWYRSADAKYEEADRKRARRSSYAPSQMEVIRVAHIEENLGYRRIIKKSMGAMG